MVKQQVDEVEKYMKCSVHETVVEIKICRNGEKMKCPVDETAI
jgi:hypothetical protein